MPITPQNILRHELIGLQCAVSGSKNKKQEGIGGTVVDETRNTIVILRSEKTSKVAKADADFIFALPSGRMVKVSGRLLVARPENRIKTKTRKW